MSSRSDIRGLLLPLLLALGLVGSAHAVDPRQVLRQAMERIGTKTYAGTAALIERQSDGYAANVSVQMRRKGKLQSIKVTAGPAFYKGAMMVYDGKRASAYLPRERRLYVYPAGPPPQERVRNLGRGAEIVLVGTEQIAGRPCHHITLSAADNKIQTDLWIDTAEFVILRRETRIGGNLWHSLSFDKVEVNGEIAAKELALTTPKGTTVIDVSTGKPSNGIRVQRVEAIRRHFGLRVMGPTHLPPDYTFDAYLIHPPTAGNIFRRRISTRWSHTGSVITLTQGALSAPAPDEDAGQAREAPQEPTEVKPNVFFWVKDYVRLALIGPRDLNRAELRKCAASVTWNNGVGNNGVR